MSSENMADGLALTLVTSLCGTGSCPTVYQSNRGTMVVQGYPVSANAAGVQLPEGEFLVEIPEDVLLEAARRYAARPDA